MYSKINSTAAGVAKTEIVWKLQDHKIDHIMQMGGLEIICRFRKAGGAR